jgi:hypothetical protein
MAKELAPQTEQELTIPELQAIERSRDVELASRACEDVFRPEFEVTDDIKHEVCEMHVRTLQKMWLPEEYTQMQADVYARAGELFSRSRNTLNLERRKQFDSQAREEIFFYDQMLVHDPVAQDVRGEVKKALYDKMSPEFQTEFAQTVGLHVDEIIEPLVEREVVDPIYYRVARRMGGVILSLTSSFKKS